MHPNAPLEPGVWSGLSPASDKSPCTPPEKVGLAPILFNWNHFSLFITLPVSETYLRLRSVGKKGAPLSALDSFKIHKSRGLGFLSASLHNNENSNILCKNSWQEIFLLLHSCSILLYQSINILVVWQECRQVCSFLTGTDGHKSHPITSHAYSTDGERGAFSHISAHIFQIKEGINLFSVSLYSLTAGFVDFQVQEVLFTFLFSQAVQSEV